MSYEAYNAPLGIFNMLQGAYDANQQIVKQASATNNLPAVEYTKEASAQPTRQNNILGELEKSASIYMIASEQFSKQASEAKGQPGSPNGPVDNEGKPIPPGRFSPPAATHNQPGNKGLENDGAGTNHVKTDEDSKSGLGYTASSDALGKKAEIEALRAYLKKMASGQHTTVGSSGRAAGQPGSPNGPADDESAKINNNTKGNHMVTGSPQQVAATTAQEAERHNKSHEFPIGEPQGHKPNSQSGPGAGPTQSADTGPDPHKTAAARQYILNMLKIAQEGEKEDCCHKCKKEKHACKCPPEKDEGQKKESMMDPAVDPSAEAGGLGTTPPPA